MMKQIQVNRNRRKRALSLAVNVPKGMDCIGVIENTEYENTACLWDKNGVFYSAHRGQLERIPPEYTIALAMDIETDFISAHS